MKKVCVVVCSRANYASIKSVMKSVVERSDLKLQLVVGASALLDRFGAVADIIRADGFNPDAEVHMIIEGETPVTMAKSAGLGLLELPTIFNQLKPDVVVTVGDRFETISTAIAAAYMNIPLAHTMGGEITGTIDESVRHAITKLAHVHFPANEVAAERLIRMGEDPASVHVVGCPRIDEIAQITSNDGRGLEADWLEHEGVGGHISPDEPFLLVLQHPVTTEYGLGEQHVSATLEALKDLRMPTVMLWPNVDAGSDDIARGIRKFRESVDHGYVRFFKNFPLEVFARLMQHCACMVGNSSAAVREGAFLGTPAVNIGSRQTGRQRGRNVIDVSHDTNEIVNAIRQQLRNGRYDSEPIYGDGSAGRRIAAILAESEIRLQKRLWY